MTRAQFDKLWVGAIVFWGEQPYRVKGFDRDDGELTLARMPEHVEPRLIAGDIRYEEVVYNAAQRPPIGHYPWDQDDVPIKGRDAAGMTAEDPTFTCDMCGARNQRSGGVFRHKLLCLRCYKVVHSYHDRPIRACYMCQEDAFRRKKRE